MTDVYHGVYFDMGFSTVKELTAWTTRDDDDGWLALDRDGDGKIQDSTELFGNHTEQEPSSDPNGYRALAEFDKLSKGGNDDGSIDARDAIFASLLIWQDKNHDGISQPEELHHLSDFGIRELSLKYRETRKVDKYGNQFRFEGGLKSTSGVDMMTYDVFPVLNPPGFPPIPKS